MKDIFSHSFFSYCTFLQLWCTVYPHFYLIYSELFKQKVRPFSLLISVQALWFWQGLHQISAFVNFVVWELRQEVFRVHLTLQFSHSWILIPTRKNKKKLFVFSAARVHILSFIEMQQFLALKGLWLPAGPEAQGTCFLPGLKGLLVESCVGASAQKLLKNKSFSSFLWWVRRFERSYLITSWKLWTALLICCICLVFASQASSVLHMTWHCWLLLEMSDPFSPQPRGN